MKKICREARIHNCFVWSYPFLVSLLFGVPLSLHLVTFLMFFNLVYVIFLAAAAALLLNHRVTMYI